MVKYSDLRRAAVYSYLVRCCLNLTENTLKDCEYVWGLDFSEVERLGIVSCPSDVTNIIASGACAEKYGLLGDIPGFYRCGNSWWLDCDERLARRGLLVPVRDMRRPNLIVGLKVFRHVRDEKPFMLRVRAEGAVAA